MFHHLAVILSLLGTAGITTWMAHRRGGRTTPRRTGAWDVLKAWVEGRSRVAMEREQRTTTLETLKLIATLPQLGQALIGCERDGPSSAPNCGIR